jgi:hypothetical protein
MFLQKPKNLLKKKKANYPEGAIGALNSFIDAYERFKGDASFDNLNAINLVAEPDLESYCARSNLVRYTHTYLMQLFATVV